MKFFKFALVLFIFASIERFCHYQTKGFSVSKTLSNLYYNPEWEVPELKQEERTELDAILDQKFILLGSGGSFFTFISQDKKYVIKFFKMHHLYPFSWLTSSPLSMFYQPLVKKYALDNKNCNLSLIAVKLLIMN